jgi:hypothetical protein
MRVKLGNEAVGAIVGEPEVASPVFAPQLGGEQPTTGRLDPCASGYCLWEFEGAAWILKKDRSHDGYVPSAPPSVPGRFRGQLRAVMAVPASAVVVSAAEK